MRSDWKKHLNLGLEIVSYVLVFFYGGYYLDKYLDTFPFFTLFGSAIAIISVFYTLWRRYIRR